MILDARYESDKEFYRKAADASWLKIKIADEKASIKVNEEMIRRSKQDILICEELLEEMGIK